MAGDSSNKKQVKIQPRQDTVDTAGAFHPKKTLHSDQMHVFLLLQHSWKTSNAAFWMLNTTACQPGGWHLKMSTSCTNLPRSILKG